MNILWKSLPALSMALLIGCNMSGCGLFETEPFADAEKDEQGNLTLRDTPRMWRDWAENVDFRVSNEVADRRPPGGASTWNEFWLALIDANKEGRENAQKYIDYIIERRKEANLPPLDGYPD